MYTHVSKCKNDTCWNYSRNWGDGVWRRMVEGVSSCMIYLIYCKNLCKWHNVSLPITTIKEKSKNKRICSEKFRFRQLSFCYPIYLGPEDVKFWRFFFRCGNIYIDFTGWMYQIQNPKCSKIWNTLNVMSVLKSFWFQSISDFRFLD
jgi:hypothetical protein